MFYIVLFPSSTLKIDRETPFFSKPHRGGRNGCPLNKEAARHGASIAMGAETEILRVPFIENGGISPQMSISIGMMMMMTMMLMMVMVMVINQWTGYIQMSI